MSLTGFLQAQSDVRTALRQAFPLPRTATFPSLQASPLTTNFALVGQAFDYLLRFYLQRHHPAAPQESQWIADWVRAEYVTHDEEGRFLQQQERATRGFLERAHAHHKTYLDNGEITDDLLKSCLDLAAIDGLVRAGEIRATFGTADPRDLRDLRNLLTLIPAHLCDQVPCVLNPAFAFPSGADCDLLLGTTLIEIKTTKFSQVKLDYFQQLLGYYLLNLHDQKRHLNIEHLGIYFSRHGYLWTTSIADLGGKEAFTRFLPQWRAAVDAYHRPREVPARPLAQPLNTLIAQVNQLTGVTSYMTWLARLSSQDFETWCQYEVAPYMVQGALGWERERRHTRRPLFVSAEEG